LGSIESGSFSMVSTSPPATAAGFSQAEPCSFRKIAAEPSDGQPLATLSQTS
jgi:hypothetical protein